MLSLVFAVVVLQVAAQASALIYPVGIENPEKSLAGVEPGQDAGSCCWMGRTAVIRVAVPPQSDTVIVKIFIPDFALSNGQTQRVTARIDGGAPESACCFGPGLHELAFHLPKPARSHASIALEMSHTFTAAGVRQGADRRNFSVLLREIDFRNTVGEFATSAVTTDAKPWQLALFLIALLAVSISVAFRPIAAVVWIVATDPFSFSVIAGTTTLTLPKVVLLGALVGIVLRVGARFPKPDRVALSYIGAQLLLMGAMVLASSHAEFKGPAVREILKAVQYLLTFGIAYTAFRLDPQERFVRWTLALVTLAVCVLAIAQEWSGAPMSAYVMHYALQRIAGPLEGPNQLGGFLGIALPVLAAYALTARHRYLEITAIAAGCLAAVLTFSRGTLLGIAVAACVLFVLIYRPAWKKGAYIALAALFAMLFATAALQFVQAAPAGIQTRIFGSSNGDFNGGLGSRAALWHGAYLLWRQSPLIGIGPGNYELRISEVGAAGVRTHANSVYFQFLAETGVVGFACMLAVLLIPIRTFARNTATPLAIGMLAAALGLAFHQIIDYLTFFPKVGIVWFAVLGVTFALVSTINKRDLASRASTSSA